jgi:hypothetical protein
LILVDSSVWLDYFRGRITPQTDKLDLLLGREPLAIGDVDGSGAIGQTRGVDRMLSAEDTATL